jgi:hypothetical protein
MTFTACKSRSTARRRYPDAARIVKVEGGYMCFASTMDWYLWAVLHDVRAFDTPLASALRRRSIKSRIFDWEAEFPPKDEP